MPRYSLIFAFVSVILLIACAPQAQVKPTVDVIGTAASTATAEPSATPTGTAEPTSVPTATETPDLSTATATAQYVYEFSNEIPAWFEATLRQLENEGYVIEREGAVWSEDWQSLVRTSEDGTRINEILSLREGWVQVITRVYDENRAILLASHVGEQELNMLRNRTAQDHLFLLYPYLKNKDLFAEMFDDFLNTLHVPESTTVFMNSGAAFIDNASVDANRHQLTEMPVTTKNVFIVFHLVPDGFGFPNCNVANSQQCVRAKGWTYASGNNDSERSGVNTIAAGYAYSQGPGDVPGPLIIDAMAAGQVYEGRETDTIGTFNNHIWEAIGAALLSADGDAYPATDQQWDDYAYDLIWGWHARWFNHRGLEAIDLFFPSATRVPQQ